jgi:dihydroneopterin aldolase
MLNKPYKITRCDFDKNHYYKLLISDLRIWLRLGYKEEERFYPQLVSFNIELIFKFPPVATTTDKLEDTVCYLEIVQNVKNLCQSKEFCLIEYLAAEIYRDINKTLEDKKHIISQVNVTICKMSPPIADIHGGVSFTYCDAPIIQESQLLNLE